MRCFIILVGALLAVAGGCSEVIGCPSEQVLDSNNQCVFPCEIEGCSNGTCNAGVCEPNADVEYEQDFESLDQTSGTALGDDGWTVFGNVLSPDGLGYLYGYGPHPAPNGTAGFCGIADGQGGPDQGAQQLVIFSDYDNGDQAVGNRVDANTFRERTIVAGDVGKTLTFSFGAKRGNINDPSDPKCTPGDIDETPNPPCDSTALAFIRTLNPSGFATTSSETVDTTNLPDSWARYSITLVIDAGLVGQLLQVGFSATASNYEPSGVFYDNVLVTTSP